MISYSATLQEIADNDYNLNIPRYVDTVEEEAPIDLDQVQQDLKNIDKEIAEVEQEINAYLKELGVYHFPSSSMTMLPISNSRTLPSSEFSNIKSVS